MRVEAGGGLGEAAIPVLLQDLAGGGEEWVVLHGCGYVSRRNYGLAKT